METELLTLMERAVESNDEAAIVEIINRFDRKIKRSILLTDPQERSDLEQELRVKIIEKLKMINSLPDFGFWEYIQMLRNGK